MTMTEIDLASIDAERERTRDTYLQPVARRPASSARGLHHVAVVARDLEETIRFYQGLLEFPLTEIFENRDYEGSNHFFFDIGHGNLLAFFDFPEHPMPPTQESIGGMHHVAISVPPEQFAAIRARLAAAGAQNLGPEQVTNSLYVRDPDGALIEITSSPLARVRDEVLDE